MHKTDSLIRFNWKSCVQRRERETETVNTWESATGEDLARGVDILNLKWQYCILLGEVFSEGVETIILRHNVLSSVRDTERSLFTPTHKTDIHLSWGAIFRARVDQISQINSTRLCLLSVTIYWTCLSNWITITGTEGDQVRLKLFTFLSVPHIWLGL